MISNATRADTRWLTKPKPDTRARRVRLFCFHYAGGSALIFRRWPELLSPAIEVRAVHLPGHGTRLLEPPFEDVRSLVDAFLPIMADAVLPADRFRRSGRHAQRAGGIRSLARA